MMPLRGGLAPLTLVTKTVAGNGLLNNLVAYWGLDEAAGANNALDKHSNGLTLTQVSSPGSTTGKVYAGARTFDGSADHFTRATESLLATGDVDFTIAAWVNPAVANSTHAIAGKFRATASANREWLLRIVSSRYEFRVSSNGTSGASTAIAANTYGAPATGTWALVIAWHDAIANTINISVNNGTADSVAHTPGVFASNAPFMVGTYDDAAALTFWNGALGPVMYWKNRTLDATARTALYAAGAGLAYSAFTL